MSRTKREWRRVTPNALFSPGSDHRMNACVGAEGGPKTLEAYGSGFFAGAWLMVAGAEEGAASVDSLVYPLAFVFRHGIELYLKHLMRLLIEINDTEVKQGDLLGHDIGRLFASVKAEFEGAVPPVVDASELPTAETIIADFMKIDFSGEAFRYPEDQRSNAHLAGLTLINVAVLAEHMDLIQNLLEGWIGSAEHCVQYKRDRQRE